MINLDLYFPTPVWWADTGIDNELVSKFVYEQKDANPEVDQLVTMVDGNHQFIVHHTYQLSLM